MITGYFFKIQESSIVKNVIDSTELESEISRKNYRRIIENKRLFWEAFCRASCERDQKLRHDGFTVTYSKNQLVITGRSHVISKVWEAVEKIRGFFVQGYEERYPFQILLPEYMTNTFFLNSSEFVDLSESVRCREFRIDSVKYLSFIEPTLGGLCESVNALFRTVKQSRHLKIFQAIPHQNALIRAIEVRWKEGVRLIYPILPLKVEHSSNERAVYLKMVNRQTFCDIRLQSSTGAIWVHTLFLKIHGGECIRALLTSKMEEVDKRAVEFSTFSHPVVQAYVDFMYMELEAFQEKYEKERGVDFFELLQFAHTYQVKPLFDCTVNLLSLFCTFSDVARVSFLARLYQDKQLTQLGSYLVKKSSLSPPSVPWFIPSSFPCSSSSSSGMASSISSTCITALEDCLISGRQVETLMNRRDYGSIIKNRELFWHAFCLAVSREESSSQEQDAIFSVSYSKGTFFVMGVDKVIKDIEGILEQIRRFFLQGYQEGESVRILLPHPSGEYFFCQPQQIVDLHDWTTSKNGISEQWYHAYISPHMNRLCSSVGAIFQVSKKLQLIKYDRTSSIENIDEIQISWKKEGILTYPITPLKVERSQNSKVEYLEMLKKEVACDIQLHSKNGVIPAHALFLAIHSGKQLNGILRKKMKEEGERILDFRDFDRSVVRAYVDFIYMELKEFRENYEQESVCDFFELLRLARAYQIEPLFNCSINLLSLVAKPADAERVLDVASKYQSGQLEKLGVHLTKRLESLPASSSSSSSSSRSSLASLDEE